MAGGPGAAGVIGLPLGLSCQGEQTMADLGDPIRVIEVTPFEVPVPTEIPEPSPEREPYEEPVEVPA